MVSLVVIYLLQCAMWLIVGSSDCPFMVEGLNCTVLTECTDDLFESRSRSASFPRLPQNLKISPYPDSESVTPTSRYNISWTYSASDPQPDSFVVMSQPLEYDRERNCTVYQLQGRLTGDVTVNHTVTNNESSLYHEIFTTPREDAHRDYVHRIVDVNFKARYPQYTGWLPYLVEIFNVGFEHALGVLYTI